MKPRLVSFMTWNVCFVRGAWSVTKSLFESSSSIPFAVATPEGTVLVRMSVFIPYALAMEGEDYLQVDFSGGVALVVGSEGEGISRLTEEACDRKVALPMLGALDSLNASVAAGVMMYRVLASRRP